MDLNKLLLRPYIVIMIASALLLHTFINPGIPETHDGNNHLARMANFYLAIKDYQIPPRWAPNLNYEFGYPVFNYNYYLAYIPGIIFFSITNSLELSFKLVTYISVVAAGIFTFLWLKKHTHPLIALTGAVLFIASPPYLLQIFVRGNLGDITGWAVFAMGMWSTQKFTDTTKLKYHFWFLFSLLSVFMLILSHNIIFIFGLPVWIIYGITQILINHHTQPTQKLKSVIRYLLSIMLGVGLGAYFLIPSILETGYTNILDVDLSHSFSDHFIYLKQLFYWPWGYGYSAVGLSDTMSFMLGAVQWSVVGLGMIVLIVKSKFQLNSRVVRNKQLIFFTILFLAATLATTPLSKPFWQLLPIVQKIQFPWRLLFLTSYSMAVLSGLLINQLLHNAHPKRIQFITGFIILAALIQGLHYAKPNGILHHDDYMYFHFPFTSSTQHENLSKGFDMNKNIEFKSKLADLNNDAQFEIQTWQSNHHTYTVTATQSATIIEHLMDFPGWTTYVDNQEVKIINTLPEYPGVRAFNVSPGIHQVKTVLEDNTYARISGDIVSLISLLLSAGFAALKIKKYFNATKIGSRPHSSNHQK